MKKITLFIVFFAIISSVQLANAANYNIYAPIIINPEKIDSDILIHPNTSLVEWKSYSQEKFTTPYICQTPLTNGIETEKSIEISHGSAVGDFYSFSMNFWKATIDNRSTLARYFLWNKIFAHENITCENSVKAKIGDRVTYHIQPKIGTKITIAKTSVFAPAEEIVIKNNFETTKKHISFNSNANICIHGGCKNFVVTAIFLDWTKKDFTEEWNNNEIKNPGKEEIEIPNTIESLVFESN